MKSTEGGLATFGMGVEFCDLHPFGLGIALLEWERLLEWDQGVDS